ncbi:MAG: CocE/NonD family hydrolase, partial [Gammaproteobacteria bacterium]
MWERSAEPIASPETITDFPHAVEEIENIEILLSDGCRLAARIWKPADGKPVPAILEYLPYRKRDGTAPRDALTHPYLAGHGYACVRVDMRGNGESGGLMWDEYLLQEQDDALEVIAWIVAQPWCDGKIGMMGISWGGFNALQVAARRPPELKAIITLCSTDDRYADDIHYKGGCLLNENVGWASTMLAYSSRPPDPLLVGERWREMWLERLENLPLLVENWLQHPHRDAFWRHGSVCENFDAIEAAVLAVGGWGDAYSNAVPRLLSNLKSPVRGFTGPWVHKYPHFAVPGPAIGFLQEALRWWEHWLKGTDAGVMNDPLYRAYLMEGAPPQSSYDHRDGRWIAER